MGKRPDAPRRHGFRFRLPHHGESQAWISRAGTPAAQHQEVAPAEPVVKEFENGLRQARNPDQPREHGDAKAQGEQKAQPPRHGALMFGQALGHDRHENDVVHAQHDFEKGERGEGGPDGGVGQKFDHAGTLRLEARWVKDPSNFQGVRLFKTGGSRHNALQHTQIPEDHHEA
jgi:hypothetical protein